MSIAENLGALLGMALIGLLVWRATHRRPRLSSTEACESYVRQMRANNRRAAERYKLAGELLR